MSTRGYFRCWPPAQNAVAGCWPSSHGMCIAAICDKCPEHPMSLSAPGVVACLGGLGNQRHPWRSLAAATSRGRFGFGIEQQGWGAHAAVVSGSGEPSSPAWVALVPGWEVRAYGSRSSAFLCCRRCPASVCQQTAWQQPLICPSPSQCAVLRGDCTAEPPRRRH
jgi:hypothetical protein